MLFVCVVFVVALEVWLLAGVDDVVLEEDLVEFELLVEFETVDDEVEFVLDVTPWVPVLLLDVCCDVLLEVCVVPVEVLLEVWDVVPVFVLLEDLDWVVPLFVLLEGWVVPVLDVVPEDDVVPVDVPLEGGVVPVLDVVPEDWAVPVFVLLEDCDAVPPVDVPLE